MLARLGLPLQGICTESGYYFPVSRLSRSIQYPSAVAMLAIEFTTRIMA
jgi:hypothetical protein